MYYTCVVKTVQRVALCYTSVVEAGELDITV